MNLEITEHFDQLSEKQLEQFNRLPELYRDINERVNLISRKDIDNFKERHMFHALAIAHMFPFPDGCKVMDVGTGGGFPGIPLAILFPNVQFTLVDSIQKKINAVQEVIDTLGLENAKAVHSRAEKVEGTFDFITARAVTQINKFYGWIRNKVHVTEEDRPFKNGVLYLKGGDLREEFKGFKHHFKIFPLNEIYDSEFYETKKLVYIPIR